MLNDYLVRVATLADQEALVAHRVGMFADMGVEMDQETAAAFRRWLADAMPSGLYRAWVVEMAGGGTAGHPDEPRLVAGGGITVLPWPPGPRYLGDRLAFVYNVYTEPAHRRRGLARMVMNAIHAWCREAGVSSLALNASVDGRPLYEVARLRRIAQPDDVSFTGRNPPPGLIRTPPGGGLAQTRRFR